MRELVLTITGLVLITFGILLGLPQLEKTLDTATTQRELVLAQQRHDFQVRADVTLAHNLHITGF